MYTSEKRNKPKISWLQLSWCKIVDYPDFTYSCTLADKFPTVLSISSERPLRARALFISAHSAVYASSQVYIQGMPNFEVAFLILFCHMLNILVPEVSELWRPTFIGQRVYDSGFGNFDWFWPVVGGDAGGYLEGEISHISSSSRQ